MPPLITATAKVGAQRRREPSRREKRGGIYRWPEFDSRAGVSRLQPYPRLAHASYSLRKATTPKNPVPLEPNCIASWSREGRRGLIREGVRASEAEGVASLVASVRDRRYVCRRGRCVRARAGAGRMRAPPALELDLLVRRAAQGRSRPRGARGAGRGRRSAPTPQTALRSAACWTCAGRCAIPGSCERAQPNLT